MFQFDGNLNLKLKCLLVEVVNVSEVASVTYVFFSWKNFTVKKAILFECWIGLGGICMDGKRGKEF